MHAIAEFETPVLASSAARESEVNQGFNIQINVR